jgi:hypothetical protein
VKLAGLNARIRAEHFETYIFVGYVDSESLHRVLNECFRSKLLMYYDILMNKHFRRRMFHYLGIAGAFTTQRNN